MPDCPEVTLALVAALVWTVVSFVTGAEHTSNRILLEAQLEQNTPELKESFWEATTVPQSGERSQKINTPTQDSEAQGSPSALLSARVIPSSGMGPTDKVGVTAH